MKIDFNKIVNDTLKSPSSGKWSRKNLTMFIAMVMSVMLSFIIVFKYETNAFEVLCAWLLMATGQSVLMLRDKMNFRKKDNNNEEVIG